MSNSAWPETAFGDIADFKNGLNFRSNEKGHTIKVLGVGDFQQRSTLDQVDEISEIHTEKEIDKSYHLKDGDLVFVRSNGNKALVGRCMLINTNGQIISYSGFTIRARITSKSIKPEFINLLMQGGLLRNVLKRDGRGTNISNLNQGILSKLPIPTPKLEEQSEILDVFAYWDRAIAMTENLITAKQQQFEWLCQQYFTPNSPVNSAWEHRKIGDFVKARKEKAVPCEEMPLYSLTIEDGVTAKTDRYNREFLVKDQESKTYKVVYPKDIVFNPANLRWGAIAQSKVSHKVTLSPIYEVFKILENKIDGDFLTHAITCKRQIGVFATKTEGTLIERMAVKADVFQLCEILAPPTKEEQKSIAHTLNTAQGEIKLLQALADKYRTQKRGLMQKLLSGQWRLNDKKEAA